MKYLSLPVICAALAQPDLVLADTTRELPLSASNCAIAAALNIAPPKNCQTAPLGDPRGIVIRLDNRAVPAPSETQDIVVQNAPAASAGNMALAPSNYAAAESEDGYFIHFAFNSFDLEPQFEEHLKRLSSVLAGDALGTACLRVVGHTDAVGSTAYNMDLSEKRAVMVASYLADIGGISPERMQIVPKGEGALLPDLAGNDARNRRVEFATKDSTNGCAES